MMTRDQFREHVYSILQKVKSGEMSISQGQKRIVRAAKRTTFDVVEQEHEDVEFPVYYDSQGREHQEF